MDECYLSVQGEKITLLCKRSECGHGPYAWSMQFDNGVLPETVVMARARHLATHLPKVEPS